MDQWREHAKFSVASIIRGKGFSGKKHHFHRAELTPCLQYPTTGMSSEELGRVQTEAARSDSRAVGQSVGPSTGTCILVAVVASKVGVNKDSEVASVIAMMMAWIMHPRRGDRCAIPPAPHR